MTSELFQLYGPMVFRGIAPCLSAYAEDHGICPWGSINDKQGRYPLHIGKVRDLAFPGDGHSGKMWISCDLIPNRFGPPIVGFCSNEILSKTMEKMPLFLIPLFLII